MNFFMCLPKAMTRSKSFKPTFAPKKHVNCANKLNEFDIKGYFWGTNAEHLSYKAGLKR